MQLLFFKIISSAYFILKAKSFACLEAIDYLPLLSIREGYDN